MKLKRIFYICSVFLASVSSEVFAQRDLIISGGNSVSSFVCSNRKVFTWGSNKNTLGTGLLGNGSTAAIVSAPTAVTIPGGFDIEQINSGSGAHFLALTCEATAGAGGGIFAWGNNEFGQVGDNTKGNNVNTPTRVKLGVLPAATYDPTGTGGISAGIAVVYAGNSSSYAITNSGELIAWDLNSAGTNAQNYDNASGMLGDGTTVSKSTPVFVKTANGSNLTGVTQVFAGDNVAYALVDPDGDGIGTVYSWGYGANGTLGRNATTAGNPGSANVGTAVQDSYARPVYYGGNGGGTGQMNNIVAISSADVFGMALDDQGYVWTWGNGGWNNATGNTIVNYSGADPRKVIAGNTTGGSNDGAGFLLAISIGGGQGFGMAVAADGKPVAWGGQGLVQDGTNAICSNGGLTGTGNTISATAGGPGTGTKVMPSYIRGPGNVVHDDVVLINRGDTWGYYQRADGSFYTWGCNINGQLGIGSTANQSTAVLFDPPAGCDLKDPEPSVNLSPGDTTVCASKLTSSGIVLKAGFKIATALIPNYQVTWTKDGAPIASKPAGTATAANLTYTATSAGKYSVTIKYIGLNAGCSVYEDALASMTISTYPQTFTAPTNLTYCGTGISTKVNVTSTSTVNAAYDWFATNATATAGTPILGTSVASGSTNINVSGATTTAGNPNTKTVYVKESHYATGTVMPAVPCAGNPSNSNLNGYYTRIVVYDDILIDSIDIIPCNTNGSSDAGTNYTWQASVYPSMTDNNGFLVPNTAGTQINGASTILPGVAAANACGTAVSIPVKITLKGSPNGTVYFMRLKSGGNYRFFDCGGKAFPIADNVTGEQIVEFGGTVENTTNQSPANTYKGAFFNMQFTTVKPRFCDIIPVVLKESCPCQQPATVTASSSPTAVAGTLKTVTVCAGTAVSLSGAYTPGTNPLTNSIQHVWYKKQGAVGAYAPVPVAGKSLTGVAADNGVWVLRVEDGSAGTASCYKEDSVRVVVTAIPLAPTGTNPPDFCENTTVPVWTAAAATNNTLQWYTVATLGIASATAPVITNTPSGVRTAWVSQKTSTATGGCEGPRLALTTNVIPLPVAPTGTDPADFCENGTPSVWAATALSGNSLQWYTAATNGTLSTTIPTITNTPSGIRNIWVSQKTAAGCEGPRLALKTNVIAAPAPPVAGTNSNFCEGATAPTWNATALSGSSLLWYTAATGGVGNATNPTITNTAGVKNIWVSQKLTSAAGCESTRTPLTLTATPRTVITKQPKDTTLCEGTALSLVASGTGTGTVSYVWKKGTATVGTNNRILSIATAAATDAGAYTVDVTSTCGTVTSNTVNVTINTKPVITTQPTDKGGCVGSSNSLSVVATGTPAPTFAWTPIGSGTGGTTSTLSFASLKATDAGNYTVEVKNSCATVTSNIAKVAITLNETPAVTLATSIAQACGDGTKTVVLTAGASGGGSAPTFTFKENGTAISPVAQTANTFTYTIPANATTAVQTLKFTVDMVSNTACLAPAPASFNVSGTATDFKVDPQVTATIANINETKLTICEQTRNLTAATLPASFTHTWTTVGGGANVSATGALTNIAFGGSTKTTYKVESPLKLCPSAEDTVTTVTAGKLTNPDAVVALNNDKICETASAPLLKGLTGLLPGEAGTWSVPAGATNTVTPAGQTGALQVGLNRFIYTIKSSTAVAPCDIDTALVTINIEKQPDAADAGADKKTCASTYTLGATAVTNGIGTWTPASAFTGDRTLFNAVATLVDNQANEFTWTVSNGVGAKCADKTDKVIITQAGKITSASPVASQSKPICSTDAAPLLNTTGVAVLKSEESAAWVAKAPATINTSTGQTAGLVVGDNTFQYIITTTVPGCDPDTGTVVIKAIAPPVASITAPVSVQTVLPSFTANNAHTQKDPDVVVTAGTVAAGYTGAWTVTKAPNATVPAITTTTTATIKDMGKFDDQTTVVWTVKDNTLPAAVCPSAVATLVITRKDFTVSNPKDTVICESAIAGGFIVTGNVAQADNLEGVKWTALDGGTITYLSPDSSRIRVTGLPSPTLDSANYRFEYTITNKVLGNASTNTATVKVYKNSSIPVISTNSGNDITMCGSDQQLDIQATVAGRITWTNNKSLTFNNATTSSTLISGFTNTTGTVDVTVSVKNGTCPIETDNIKIIRSGELTSPTPTVDNDSSCVASTVNLSGKTPLATNLETSNWKVSPTSGVTLNTTIDVAAATATFSATGTYVFTYEIDNPTCPEKKQTVTVVVADKPATGTVTGTDPTCEEGTGTYTATGFTSTLPVTYAWTSTPSATSTATTTDAKKQSVTYTFKSTNPTAATDNATVDVIAKNACGTASGSKAVSYGLKPRVFDVPGGPITGSTQFCSTKPTTQPYTVGGSVQATKYNWKWNTQALSGTTTSNNLTDIIWGTATSGTLEVVLENACGVGTFATAKTSIAITIDQPVAFEADITSNAPDQKFCVPQAGVTYTASSIPLTVTPTGYTFSTSSSAVTQTDVALKTWLPAVDVVKDLGKVKVTITASDDPLNANFACLKNYTATDSIIMDGYKYPDSLIVSSVDTICDNQSDIVLSVNRSLNGSNKFNDNDQPRWFLNDTLAQPQFDGRFSINLGDANQSGIWKVKIPGSICSTHVSADTHRVKIYEQPDFLFAENPMVVVYQDGITKRMPVVLVSPARDSITKTTWTNETWLEYPLNDTLNALFVPKREQVELEYSLILRTGAAKFNCTTEKPLVVINALPLNIPNAFSPNGDGVNDTWVINGLIKYSSVTVSVFNRWGNKVFYSTGAYTPWDGAVNGIPVSSGTYYAIVELKGSPDGTDDNVSKALTIVR